MAISNDNKFLSLTGLNLLWEKINNKFATKAVATTSADGLMSKTDKANLDELVNLKPAEKGAQVNVIEGVAIAAVGGTAANITEIKDKHAVIRVSTDIAGATTTQPLTMAEAVAVKTYVDNAKSAANDYADSVGTSTLASAKTYADGVAANAGASALAAAKTYADEVGATTLADAKSYTDTKTSTALSDAKTYADGIVAAGMTATYNAAVEHAENYADGVGASAATALAAGMTATYNAGVTYTDGKVSTALSDAKTYADGIGAAGATALAAATETLQNQIDTLNGGSNVTGSVDNKVATAIAGVIAGATSSFDTLKEIADWIANDTTGAAKMANDIKANSDAIDVLNGEGAGSVKKQVADALDTAKNYADGVGTSTLASAKTYADGAGATALASAKSYTDTAKESVIGKSGDASTANTIYGAKAYADSILSNAVSGLGYTASTVDTPAPVVKVATEVTQTNGVVSVVYTTFTAISKSDIDALV